MSEKTKTGIAVAIFGVLMYAYGIWTGSEAMKAKKVQVNTDAAYQLGKIAGAAELYCKAFEATKEGNKSE